VVCWVTSLSGYSLLGYSLLQGSELPTHTFSADMYEKRLLYPLAGLSVSVAVHGSTVVGENYRLNCSIAGADSFIPTNITYRWFNESSIPPMQVGTQQTFTFNPLQLYHAGNYTCIVSVIGLTGNFSQSAAQIITVESKHAIMCSYQFLFTMYTQTQQHGKYMLLEESVTSIMAFPLVSMCF